MKLLIGHGVFFSILFFLSKIMVQNKENGLQTGMGFRQRLVRSEVALGLALVQGKDYPTTMAENHTGFYSPISYK